MLIKLHLSPPRISSRDEGSILISGVSDSVRSARGYTIPELRDGDADGRSTGMKGPQHRAFRMNP